MIAKYRKECNRMKVLIYLVFIILYLFVAFFGIGPVLMADGTMNERMLTLGVIILIYALLTVALVKYRQWIKKKESESK